MALKALMLRKQIDDAKKQLEQFRAQAPEFERREAELETAIQEAVTEDERSAVTEAVETFEADRTEHTEAIADLERRIGELEEELRSIEKPSAPQPEQEKHERAKEKNTMNTRKFFGMSAERRDAFFADETVKDFLQRTREYGMSKRSVTGAELLIPTVVLDVIRENVIEWSKLYKHVNVRQVPGKARQPIMGAIPEGVWTEMCATLSNLDIVFNVVEVDGFKVGGYVAVCNAVLADSDIALASEIISALGQAIGLALDKAILYGTGTRMPLGIVTRLTQAEDPGSATSGAPAWTNLSASNVLAISEKTDAALFKALVESSGAAKSRYSRGNKFWTMNETTYTKLVSNSVSINAAGAVVSGVNGVMPVIGGAIEVLNFIPDDVIIGGYGDLYLLAEREGASIAQSEHYRFIEDQTVFKGTARYDGLPVVPEAFVAIGIGGTAPKADAVTFANVTSDAG